MRRGQRKSQTTKSDKERAPFLNTSLLAMVSKRRTNEKYNIFSVLVAAAISAIVVAFVSIFKMGKHASPEWYTCAYAVTLKYITIQQYYKNRLHGGSRPNVRVMANGAAFMSTRQFIRLREPASAFKLVTNKRVVLPGRSSKHLLSPFARSRRRDKKTNFPPVFAAQKPVEPLQTNALDSTHPGGLKHSSWEGSTACRPEGALIGARQSPQEASRRAALRALVKERAANTSPTWRDYLSWLPEEEDEGTRNARMGLPPPHARRLDDLPVKAISYGNETIFYRQAMEGFPAFVDLETFERLKAQWADDPNELARVQREEKEAYGIKPNVRDDDWIPLHRNLPVGRLVVSHGRLPTRVINDEAGYDYVEEYHDPTRNYSWSYRRSNPLKQLGLRREDLPEGVDNLYDLLKTDEAKRYFFEKIDVPERELDDGIFRKPTLDEQVLSGMRRNAEGQEPWHFVPEAPFGHIASYQNFARSFTSRDIPWIESALAANATGSPPPSPPLSGGDGARPLDDYHTLDRHVSLPFDTGCASPKIHFPRGLPSLPFPKKEPPGNVAYRQLGQSDLWISEVGLGSMFFGSAQSTPCGDGNFNEIERLLDYAVDTWGINFIDTSELYPVPAKPKTYGLAENIIGQWLGSRSPTLREKLVIATKVAGPSDALKWLRSDKHFSGSVRCPSLSKENIIKAAHGSLHRLKTPYIDLLQLHWPQRYVPLHGTGDFPDVLFDARTAIERENDAQACSMDEQLEAIAELLQAGKIRAWGLSNETPYGILRFTQLAKAKGIPPPASVQVHYNLLFRSDVEKQMIELARHKNTGISLLAYGALAGGLLSGKYLEWLEPPTAGRLLRFPSYMKRLRGSIAAWAVRDYYNLARRFGQPNLTTVALKWVFSRPFITSTILGFSDYYQLRENLYCLDPVCGAMTDNMEREINYIHWKWRDPLRKIQ